MQFKKIKLNSTCPNCQKSFFRLKRLHGVPFCPHCYCNLSLEKDEKSADSNQKDNSLKGNVKLSVLLSIFIIFCYEFRESSLSSIIVIAFLIFILVGICYVLLTNGNQKHYKVGTDTYETVESDGITYTEFNHNVNNQQCQVCGSYRIVSLYWYKRILAKSMKTLPSTKNIENESHFRGCLHCHAQYEVYDPAKDNKYGYFQVIGYCLLFWIMITKGNDILSWLLTHEWIVGLGLFKYILVFILVFMFTLSFIWMSSVTNLGIAKLKRLD